MLRSVIEVINVIKNSSNLPNFPSIIWIMFVFDFMRDTIISGLITISFKVALERLNLNAQFVVVIFHCSTFIQGLLFIVGSWLADSYFGKYKVYVASLISIAIINPIICIGSFNTIFKIEEQQYMFIALIFIYTLCSFGICCKMPLYSEQFFLPEEEKDLKYFYVVSFWLQNLSFLFGVIFLPFAMTHVKCFNAPCMQLPIIIYTFVDFIYLGVILLCQNKFIHRNVTFKIIEKNIHLIMHAISRKIKGPPSSEHRRSMHFLEYAADKYERLYIKNSIRILRLMPIFFSFLTFWATKTQLQTIWVIQTSYLKDQNYFLRYSPQQIGLLNALFNIILIPFVYIYISPLMEDFCSYLKWIGTGFVFMCVSSGISSVLQDTIEHKRIGEPHNLAHFRLYNAFSEPVDVESLWTGNITLKPYDMFVNIRIRAYSHDKKKLLVKIKNKIIFSDVEAINGESVSYIIKEDGVIRLDGTDPVKKRKPLVYFICGEKICKNYEIKLSRNGWSEIKKSPEANKRTIIRLPFPGRYTIYLDKQKISETNFENGGAYSILTTLDNPSGNNISIHQVMNPNEVPLYWILPEFFFSSLGDTLSQISLNMFVYTQSPANIRTMTRALFLLCESFSAFLLLSTGLFPLYSKSMFFFTSLSFIFLILYVNFALRYKPKKPSDV